MEAPLATASFPREDLERCLETIVDLYQPKRVSPSRRDCGRRLFVGMPIDSVLDFFLAALEHVPAYVAEHEQLRQNPVLKGELGLDHILIQCFLCWTTSTGSPKTKEKWRRRGPKPGAIATDDDVVMPITEVVSSTVGRPVAGKRSAPDVFSFSLNNTDGHGKNPNGVPAEEKDAHLIFSQAQKVAIIRRLARVEFPPGIKIWPLVAEALQMPKNDDELLVGSLCAAADTGEISFSALEYCAPLTAKPKYLVQALLLGPLSRDTIAAFIDGRDWLRADVKRALTEAETWTKSEPAWQKAVQKWAHTEPTKVPKFAEFREWTLDLLRQLRGGPPRNNVIAYGWAREALSMACKKRYISRQWTVEHIDDVAQTVLSQQPRLKGFLVQMLRKDYDDAPASAKWLAFNPRGPRARQFSKVFKIGRWHESEPGYLALPKGIDVIFVDVADQLHRVEDALAMLKDSEPSAWVVGLDAEWSSYVGASSASILQIAFRWVVFIVDLDALYKQKRLISLLEKIFGDPLVIKIGFAFSEDLVQMRERVTNCLSLYRPDGVICIGKLIAHLLLESSRRSFDADQMFAPDEPLGFVTDESLSAGEGVLVEDPSADAAAHAIAELELDPRAVLARQEADRERRAEMERDVKAMGMSSLCKRMLGAPLDKTEQCSVWDRRPLRYRQMRYAALDAYACLMLYDRCLEWATRMDCSDADKQQLIFGQDPIRVPLPLFWEGAV
ncbi:3'-5' exonuclease [Aphelenchoides avenae]|nr:3'-5' exonuclease [Aphelenchus avenae]